MSHTNPEKKFDVFLSHDWGVGGANHKRVEKINEQLKARKLDTWFDTDKGRMSGHVNMSMAEGIDASRVGLAFVTRAYHDKVYAKARLGIGDNCFMEFDFMTRSMTAEKMIAVVLEPELKNNLEWKGLLGLTMGGRMYVDMTGKLDDPQDMNQQMDKLVEKIHWLLGRTTTPEEVVNPSAAAASMVVPAAASVPLADDDPIRKLVLEKPIKGNIKQHIEVEMNKDRATVVFALCHKFKVDNMKVQEIRDSMAGGGDTTEKFLTLLLSPYSKTTIEEVREALDELEMEAAKKEWDKITEGETNMSELQLYNVMPMSRYLKRDPQLAAMKSWVDLADALPKFPQEKIDDLKDTIADRAHYSAADALLSHLKRERYTLGDFLEKLHEVQNDKLLPSCISVIDMVEKDIGIAITKEKKKIGSSMDLR